MGPILNLSDPTQTSDFLILETTNEQTALMQSLSQI